MENREKLQLTTQMLNELGRTIARIEALHETVYKPIVTQLDFNRRNDEKMLTATAELNTLKVALENMLSETDIKAKSSLTAPS